MEAVMYTLELSCPVGLVRGELVTELTSTVKVGEGVTALTLGDTELDME